MQIFVELPKLAGVATAAMDDGEKTDEEQAKHDKEMTTEQDYQDALAFHKEESFKEGLDAARMEIARNMKASGVSDAIISKCTGLPEDKVNAL